MSNTMSNMTLLRDKTSYKYDRFSCMLGLSFFFLVREGIQKRTKKQGLTGITLRVEKHMAKAQLQGRQKNQISHLPHLSQG